jgi:gas vesicle protein
MFPIFEIITIFAVLNATISNQEVPIEVAVSPVATPAAEQQTATANPVFDTAAITGIIAAIGGLLVAWRKGSSNDNAIADTITNLKESLKQTDKGVAEQAAIVSKIAEQTKAPEAPAAAESAKAWNNDLKAYYENFKPAGPEDMNLNKTKSKLAVVNKETTKTEP